MATSSIDKALDPGAGLLGLGSMMGMMDDSSPAIEIQIEDPEGVQIGVDGLEIDLEPGDDKAEGEFNSNLAEEMEESELQKLAGEIVELVDSDISSRKDWTETYVKGLEVLGMRYEERTQPWNGACGVYSTILTEAAIRFQSETITETFPAAGPVKTEIIGAIDRLKEEAAERVRDDMNFRLTEEMPEYRPEHERLLFNLGLAGAAFKKVYYDPGLARQTAIFIPAEDVIIPYGSSGARTAERVTHVMRKTKNEIKKLQVAGFYREVDLGEPVATHTDVEKKKADEQGYSLTDDDRYQLYEVQVDWDMPGYESDDEVAIPYIVTIDKGTNKVLAIYRNWEDGDDTHQKRQHLVQYDYIPGFGAYGMGLIHIIGGYARAGTSLIRQLVDAGTLSNLPGGLKSRGLRVKGDDTPIAPGEFRDVDIPSGAIKDNIMTLPYKEPSQVLLALLNQITDEGRRLGSIADMKVSDMSAQSPVGTTLALLERQLKIMGAVQARVHNSMKQEFKLLKAIIRDHTPSTYDYTPEHGEASAKQEDYDTVEVIPVSDPNSSTMAQRIMQYQAVIQLSQGAPQIYDLPQLHRQMIEVLGIKNAEKLVPLDEDQTPRDPISENMSFLKGEPTKAFIYQDHDAHIAAHSTFMQDPMIAQQMGQNPMAQQMMAAIQSHIAEHLAYLYRQKIEEQMGVTMPKPNEQLPEEVEVQLSQLVAQASVQLLQQNMAMAQQAKSQQMQQDPLIQMQQKELQIKEQDSATKAKKVDGELQIKQGELALKAQQAGAPQETPQMVQQRHTQEMQAQQGQQQMLQQKHMQEMMRAQQAHQANLQQQHQIHGQKMAHGGMTARQKLTHTELMARQKFRQMQEQQRLAKSNKPGDTE
jgi:hypothetical protein